MWDEITNPFPNLNGGAVEVWEWISNFIPHFMTDMMGVVMHGTFYCFVCFLSFRYYERIISTMNIEMIKSSVLLLLYSCEYLGELIVVV